MDNYKIKKRLLTSVIIGFISLILAIFFISKNYVEHHTKLDSIDNLEAIYKALNIHKEEQINEMINTAYIIQHDKEFQKNWINQNEKLLDKTFSNYFNSTA